MRPCVLLLLAVVACGGPAFVPVSFTMTDTYAWGYIVAYAANDAGPAIEDGGCDGLTIRNDGTIDCPPGGGVYLPFLGVASYMTDGGLNTSWPRGIAPGSRLSVSDLGVPQGGPRCAADLAITVATEIRVTRTDSACTITSQ